MKNTRAQTRGLWQFFALTYLITWLTWGSMVILRMPGGSTDPNAPPPAPLALSLLLLGGFAPSIAGIIMKWRTEGAAGLRDLWERLTRFALGWRAYIVIVLLPLLVLGWRAVLYLLRGGTLGKSDLFADPLALTAFCVQIALLGPISEEFGWRGFALDGLLARWRPLGASLVLGALWAFWHLPLFFIPGAAQAGYGSPLLEFPIFALLVVALAVVYTWLFLGTGRSLWAAILFHFTFNFCISLWATLADDGWGGRCLAAVILSAAAVVIALGWRRRPAAARIHARPAS